MQVHNSYIDLDPKFQYHFFFFFFKQMLCPCGSEAAASSLLCLITSQNWSNTCSALSSVLACFRLLSTNCFQLQLFYPAAKTTNAQPVSSKREFKEIISLFFSGLKDGNALGYDLCLVLSISGRGAVGEWLVVSSALLCVQLRQENFR